MEWTPKGNYIKGCMTLRHSNWITLKWKIKTHAAFPSLDLDAVQREMEMEWKLCRIVDPNRHAFPVPPSWTIWCSQNPFLEIKSPLY